MKVKYRSRLVVSEKHLQRRIWTRKLDGDDDAKQMRQTTA